MTADWVHLPYDFLMKVSNDIINKVKEWIEWSMTLAQNHQQQLNGNKF
jgi:GMP synthase PP-ATPase subunit